MKSAAVAAYGVLLLGITACTPFSVFTTAVTQTGQAITDERTTGERFNDATILTKITHAFLQSDVNDLLVNVDPYVNEGRVLLAGRVDSPETSVEAIRIAWSVEGVREVIDELKTAEDADPSRYGSDAAISAQIKSRLLLEKDIRSVNYNVETVQGVVYLLGLAQSEEEMRRATYIASITKGVMKVVCHVRVKDSHLRRQQ